VPSRATRRPLPTGKGPPFSGGQLFQVPLLGGTPH
jgi:hypothetical protein